MCLTEWCKLYYAGGRHVRRQIWYTLLLLVVASTSVMAFLDHANSPAATLTPTNVIAIATVVISLVFTAGSIREQFAELRERVKTVERRIDEDVPETYVRKDVFHAHIKGSPLER